MGSIGDWNGSSSIAIAPNWAITASHTGGGVGSSLRFDGQAYQVLQRIPHPTADLALLRFSPAITQWHNMGATLQINSEIVVGGIGLTGQPGMPWVFPRAERWGTNRVTGYSSTYGPMYYAVTLGPHLNWIYNVMNGRVDWNGDGQVQTDDLFAFLSDWHRHDGSGDFDGNGTQRVDDIFAFLNAWMEAL